MSALEVSRRIVWHYTATLLAGGASSSDIDERLTSSGITQSARDEYARATQSMVDEILQPHAELFGTREMQFVAWRPWVNEVVLEVRVHFRHHAAEPIIIRSIFFDIANPRRAEPSRIAVRVGDELRRQLPTRIRALSN